MMGDLGLLSTYPYLFSSLVGVLLLAGGCAFHRVHRGMAIRSGALTVWLCPLAVPHEQGYWTPERLAGWSFGIEDVLFSFTIGGLGWLLAVLPTRSRLTSHVSWRAGVSRFAVVYVLTIVQFLVLWGAGVGAFAAGVTVQCTVGGVVLATHRRYWTLALSGAIMFAVCYIVFLQITFWMWPGFLSAWNHENQWFRMLHGIPMSEILWACTFGAAWPLGIAYAFKVELCRTPEGGGNPLQPENQVS